MRSPARNRQAGGHNRRDDGSGSDYSRRSCGRPTGTTLRVLLRRLTWIRGRREARAGLFRRVLWRLQHPASVRSIPGDAALRNPHSSDSNPGMSYAPDQSLDKGTTDEALPLLRFFTEAALLAAGLSMADRPLPRAPRNRLPMHLRSRRLNKLTHRSNPPRRPRRRMGRHRSPLRQRRGRHAGPARRRSSVLPGSWHRRQTGAAQQPAEALLRKANGRQPSNAPQDNAADARDPNAGAITEDEIEAAAGGQDALSARADISITRSASTSTES